MHIGAQTYTVRNHTQTAEDLGNTFKKLQEIGFEYIQISAIGPIPPETVRQLADKHSLKIILTHSNPDRILNDTDNLIKDHKIMGAKYIGMGAMPEKYRQDKQAALAFVSDYKTAAKKMLDEGCKFMYHNHGFEFEKCDGKYLLEYLIEGFSPSELGFVLDTYWVAYAGCDPVEWLNRLSGRCETIHFKDMIFSKGQHKMSEVMEGNLNWKGIFKACDQAKVDYAFIEQDDCYGQDPFKCLATSFNNLRNARV